MDEKLRALGYVTLDDVAATLPPERRARLESESRRLITERMSLQQMRKVRKLTQVRLAKKLKVGQESISRIEQRTDLHLSTLRHYIEAMGGSLSLIAQFPDRPPIELSGIGNLGLGEPASPEKPVADVGPKTTRKTARKIASRTRPRPGGRKAA